MGTSAIAANDVQIPAITTNLYDPVVTTQTAKEWYLYWHQSGDRINDLNGMVTYGSSGNRLLPSQAPYGALYIQTDQSGVVYQNQGGAWHYIAGTMYGTISPDQRPTGLGVNDAGFEFRSTDTNPLLGGHTWIWSGTAWIEVTPNRYGTHASRLALNTAGTWNGMIWIETDRSEVIYQNQSGVWHFLAGTMWGTISPDQRPTDLGANDAGFTFRGTDQVRSFVWSGTVWVETTPVTGAVNLTHPNVVTKVGSTVGQIVEGGITDLSPGNSGSVNITAAGLVGIGTASPANKLEVTGTVRSTAGPDPTSGAGIELTYQGSSGYVISYDRTAGAFKPLNLLGGGVTISGEGSSISLSGNVGIQMSNPTYSLQLISDSAAKPGTNTWTISSDIRAKQNISRFEGDIGVIRRLDPIVAEYNGKAGTPKGTRVVSFDAEKLREILPHAVSSVRGKLNPEDAEETDILGVNTHEIFFHMLRTIQYLDRQVEELKRQI